MVTLFYPFEALTNFLKAVHYLTFPKAVYVLFGFVPCLLMLVLVCLLNFSQPTRYKNDISLQI